MTIRRILVFPHPNLRRKANPVTEFDRSVAQLADDMLETMYESKGIGLSAVQVNLPLNLIVTDVSEEKNAPRVLVNPQLELLSGLQHHEEGCLSVPGFWEVVERADNIRVNAQSVKGKHFSFETSGLESVCIQHEVDHLSGKLFVDYLPRIKMRRIRSKLLKSSAAA